LQRREFIACLAGSMAAGMLGDEGGRLLARTRRRRRVTPSYYRLERIGVSSWSFHNYFSMTQDRDYHGPQETIALLDFPAMMADRYKLHHLEFVAPHFGSTQLSYLKELRVRLIRAHSRLVNIPVDIEDLRTEGGLSDPADAVRGRAIDAAKTWIDIAAHLGALSVRCDPGKFDPEHPEPTIDSYQKLAAYGKAKRVRVVVENHGGVGSEHPRELVNLFKKVNSLYFGSLPDFGNFPDAATRARGLALLFPYALTMCHAKGLEFDAQGNEMKYDFPACMAAAERAKFRGTYSIEYEGSGDPYQGVQNVLNELLKAV
jgi:Xylose isomerase-like TIM barrel